MHDERLRFGAWPHDRAGTAFRFCGPASGPTWLETVGGERFPLEASSGGGFAAVLPLPPGSLYRYLIEDNGHARPVVDPASRQPQGPDGFSIVVDPEAHDWQNDGWRGRPLHGLVLCEIDAASPSFGAVAARLPTLAANGITAICLMPVARLGENGGPALPFAADPSLGTLEDVCRLVDEAHGLGLSVVFGTVASPFGLNMAPPGLGPREAAAFIVDCAVHWIADCRVDGLWLAPGDWPDGFAAAVRQAAGRQRRVHLLLADVDGTAPLPDGFDARWNATASKALEALRLDGASDRLAGALAGDGPVGTLEGDGAAPASAFVVGVRDGVDLGPAALTCVLASPQIPLVHERAAVAPDALQSLLRLRAERLVESLPGTSVALVDALGQDGWVASWKLGDGSRLVLGCNFGSAPLAWTDAPGPSHRVHATDDGGSDELPPGAARVYLVPGLSRELAELADHAGVALDWSDQSGRPQTVSRDTVLRVLDALGHPCDSPQAIAASLAAIESAERNPAMLTARVGESVALPLPPGLAADGLRASLVLESGETRQLLASLREAETPGAARTLVFDGFDTPGYHRLALESGGRAHEVTLAVAPPRAFDAGLQRAWGTSVQLHSLRPESTRVGPDPGLGDFSALAAFALAAGAAGAHVLAISPTHAGFAADATDFSPYSPSSRLFHNVLFIDPLAVHGVEAGLQAASAAGLAAGAAPTPSADDLIDWPAARRQKLRWLRALFDLRPPDLALPLDDALRLHATFEALHAHFHAQGHFDWRQWPEAFQDPESETVAAFVEAQADDVRFHAWLQQLAEAGLEAAQRAARHAGMQVGLVSDLAIGMSGAGSHAWASRRDLLVGLEIGAPPDSMNPRGQRWGLTAFSPTALVERRFEPFLQTLRAAMRQTGGVRIDHVLGLNRLWLVPAGLPATDGAYVRYPLRDFLNLLILESHRQRAIVIGEDLGTVPDGFREVLAAAGVRGMAVLWLERTSDGVGFKPPAAWAGEAVGMTTTHDLPTAAGWWKARDIDWREKIGIEADAAAARRQREAERQALAVLVPDVNPDADGVDLAIAAVSAASNALVLVPVEDLLGLVEQPNLPGTVDEHPNWRRRLPGPADRLLDAGPARARVDALRRSRGG